MTLESKKMVPTKTSNIVSILEFYYLVKPVDIIARHEEYAINLRKKKT